MNQKYGDQTLQKVRKYEQLSISRAKYKCHLHFNLHCKHHNVIPKSLKIKSPIDNEEARRLIHKTQKALLNIRISETQQKQKYIADNLTNVENELKSILPEQLFEEYKTRNDEKEKRAFTKSTETQKKKFQILTNGNVNTNVNTNRNVNTNETESNRQNVSQIKAKWVKNLSKRTLTETEKEVLSKGAGFAVVPKQIPYNDYIIATEKACKKLDKGQADALRGEITEILIEAKQPKPNLSKQESKALNDLRKDDSIVILPADKGKCLVIMDNTEYIQKMEDKLKDETTYKGITEDPSKEIQTNINKLLIEIREKGELKNDALFYKLRPTKTLIPRMYGQPKIHKENYPMREIVDSTGGVTKDIDKYIASIIKTYTGKSEYYVKNSAHFVSMIKDLKVDDDELLVSYDVTALYPSVPQDEAIELVHQRMIDDPDLSKKTTMSAESVTKLFKMCVQKTYFVFNKKLYMQINGLAIGASTSGFAADIFMECLETRALSTFIEPPTIWKRYVDDTFSKLKKIRIDEFLSHLNQQHTRIKFTSEIQENLMLPFLDNKVHVEPDGSTKITIYRKKTHTDQYLDFKSNHHIQQKLGIVTTFKNRIETLITKDEDKVLEEEHVKNALKNCGYPDWSFNRKRKSTSEDQIEPYAKVIIPYIPKLSERLAQKYKKYNIETIHKPTKKIRGIVCHKMKDKVHELDKTGAVYHTGCLKGCDRTRTYVGETERVNRFRLYEHRVISHKEANSAQSLKTEPTETNKIVVRKATRTSNRKKAIINYKELNEGKQNFVTEGATVVSAHVAHEAHNLEDMFYEIVDQDDDWLSRGYKEAIAIKNLKPDLNEDEGRCYIPHIYNQLFRTSKYKESVRPSKYANQRAEKTETLHLTM